MKLSTRARYGTRTMLELALNYGKGPVSAKEMARRQGLSPKYLEHLIARLKAAGLIKAVRGIHGGYVLPRSPAQIRLIDIFQVLEGSAALVKCVDSPDVCSRKEFCVTRHLWAEMRDAIVRILDSTTLEDMVQWAKEKT